jgi:carbamoyl-phosphate synthase large subunit
LADSFGLAFFKAQEAAGMTLPTQGTVLITVSDHDKAGILAAAQGFKELGLKILATDGTQKYLALHGVESQRILKIYEGRPHIVDALKNGEIQLIVNTPKGKLSEIDDSYIRKSAIKYKIPYLTTTTAALAATVGISAARKGKAVVKSLQEYHRDIDQEA